MAEAVKPHKTAHQDKFAIPIFFDTESDNENGLRLGIKSNKLVATFEQINGKDPDHILWIAVYKSPLEEGKFHIFVVLETDRWYYSIEVTDKHVTIQRSVQLVYVRDMHQRQSRQKTWLSRIFGAFGSGEMDCLTRAYGKGTVRDVMEFLCEGSRLNANFQLMLTNDQELTKWLFDLFNADMKEFHYGEKTTQLDSSTQHLSRKFSVSHHENHAGSVFFHSDTDNHTHRFHHRDLVHKYDEINAKTPDCIDTVELYETPLEKRFFIVLRTDNGWFYSIDELHNITIQRSKMIELVRDRFLDGHRDYQQENRRASLHDRHRTSSVAHEMPHIYATAKGTKTVRNVMAYLQRNAHLNSFFDLPLAQRLFNKFNSEGMVETAAPICERHKTM